MMKNIQSFSVQSEQYARHRPHYPAALFEFLSGVTEHHDCAWDCATGNGQAALACAAHFPHVEATDVSAEQIQHCLPHTRIRYSVSPAEQTPFANQAFDLIMVAQAIHWFDLAQFFNETERVLKPGGILAAWGYGFLDIERPIDDVISRELLAPIDPFWASGNRLVMNGYRDLALPYTAVAIPHEFSMTVAWDLPQLLAYLRTWSAVKRVTSELGHDPVARLEPALMALWDHPDTVKTVRMPLYLKVCRKPG